MWASGADLDKARRAVALTKEAGIDVRAAYMIGNPGETLATMQETLDFAIELDTEVAIFNIATPFPGNGNVYLGQTARLSDNRRVGRI